MMPSEPIIARNGRRGILWRGEEPQAHGLPKNSRNPLPGRRVQSAIALQIYRGLTMPLWVLRYVMPWLFVLSIAGIAVGVVREQLGKSGGRIIKNVSLWLPIIIVLL